MSMRKSVVTYVLVSLNLLLLFLATFSSSLQLPTILQWGGRLHPMILHFPIALILLTIILYFFPLPPTTSKLLTLLSALTAVITALLGLFLSATGEYDAQLVTSHLWLGVGTSILTMLWWIFRDTVFWKRLCTILVVPTLIIGSHYGASLTHGEDYIRWPEEEVATPQRVITDSTAIFTALVEPILAAKCYSCHNEKKAKGELVMTSVASLLKGGKNGPLWKAADPLNSHILQRAQLPEDDKKHMPPRGKAQLTANELVILEAWISAGANLQKRFLDYPATDSFRMAMQQYVPKPVQGKTWEFEAASPSAIQSIQTPFMHIQPLALGSPALMVRFMVRTKYDPASLKALQKIAPQVVELHLDNMPVTDQDLQYLQPFEHLSYLNLNNTSITGKGLEQIRQLPALQELALAGTALAERDLRLLTSMPALKKVYCWNSKLDSAGLASLQAANKNLQWELGFKPSQHEVLKLTTPQYVDRDNPIFRVGDTVRLKHPMPGVEIYYTLDGSAPDSLHATRYPGYIVAEKLSQIRAIACRPGWLTSDTLNKLVFIQSALPTRLRLNGKPDTLYRLSGAPSLMDGKTGDVNNTGEHWMGFYGTVCDLNVYFSEPRTFREVVVSTLKKTGPHIFPPSHLELWAGNDSLHLTKISERNPAIPDHYDQDRIEAQVLPSKRAYQYYRIKVFPVKALPAWHNSKGKKVWVFVDEVFFN